MPLCTKLPSRTFSGAGGRCDMSVRKLTILMSISELKGLQDYRGKGMEMIYLKGETRCRRLSTEASDRLRKLDAKFAAPLTRFISQRMNGSAVNAYLIGMTCFDCVPRLRHPERESSLHKGFPVTFPDVSRPACFPHLPAALPAIFPVPKVCTLPLDHHLHPVLHFLTHCKELFLRFPFPATACMC